MNPVKLPDTYNYIAAFLTLSCNLGCSYCINRFDVLRPKRKQLTGEEWVSGLGRLLAGDDLPVTLQGGEPSQHQDFIYIVKNLRENLKIDILTNLAFDTGEFMNKVAPDRLRRPAPYASIRVSYHPEKMAIEPLADRVLQMQEAGYSIGIWGVLHPKYEEEVMQAQGYCLAMGIDFRTKEFLGEYNDRVCGTLKYPGSCSRTSGGPVRCRTSELLIGPDGYVYHCHSDLYAGRNPAGHILDPELEVDYRFRSCSYFGYCNPCDVKIKNNRFQVFGYTAVEILMEEKSA